MRHNRSFTTFLSMAASLALILCAACTVHAQTQDQTLATPTAATATVDSGSVKALRYLPPGTVINGPVVLPGATLNYYASPAQSPAAQQTYSDIEPSASTYRARSTGASSPNIVINNSSYSGGQTQGQTSRQVTDDNFFQQPSGYASANQQPAVAPTYYYTPANYQPPQYYQGQPVAYQQPVAQYPQPYQVGSNCGYQVPCNQQYGYQPCQQSNCGGLGLGLGFNFNFGGGGGCRQFCRPCAPVCASRCAPVCGRSCGRR